MDIDKIRFIKDKEVIGSFDAKDSTAREELSKKADSDQVYTKSEVDGLISNLKTELLIYNGGAHNAIYRGKYLGTSVTTTQYAAISSGTFDDLYIGDYWTIGGVNYRIAAFDYYWNCGDNATPPHHAGYRDWEKSLQRSDEYQQYYRWWLCWFTDVYYESCTGKNYHQGGF